jgi:D-proline reductase (dithiol) PrdB
MVELVAGRSDRPPADYIAETRRLYGQLGYDDYRWAERTDVPPWTPIERPLSDCRVMLVGSGGIYRRGQTAFHTRDDTSVRLIDATTPTSELRTAHFAYDQTDARVDPNCVFPLDTLRGLMADGVIAGLTDHAVAFMGGIYSVRRMEAETARHVLDQCHRQQPDLVLLVPV